MIAELLFIAITVKDGNFQCDQVAQATFEQVECIGAVPLVSTPLQHLPVRIKRHCNYDAHHYRYLSKRHTDMAILHTGHARVIYWKRIRSRTWKKKITSQLEVLTIILIMISVI